MTPKRFSNLLRALWQHRRKESELDEEIAFHLSEEADERRESTPDDALAAARRDFGNVQLVREATRDTWGWASTERLFQDVRTAVRMIRRDRAFAAVAVLTLALGIGATTAILNVVHAQLLRPLPYHDAGRLVVLFATSPARGVSRDTTSFHDFTAWKTQTQAFESAAAYRQDDFNLTGEDVPEPLRGLRATEGLLHVLAVNPAIGRTFTAAEQRANEPVAIISHDLWTRRFGRDPRTLGHPVILNEAVYSVVGVLPAGFQFPPFQQTDLIVPLPERTCRSCGYLRGVARLKTGVPPLTAQRELDGVAASLEQAFPDSNAGRGVNVVALDEVAVGAVRTPVLVLLAAGAFVLLIGCGNVGNLVLARSLDRRREFAIRNALGAGRTRLIRQLLTESVSLALVAAALGAIFAILGSRLLGAALAERTPLPPVTFGWPLLAWAVAIALVSGFLSGIPPILMVWKSILATSLRQDGRNPPAIAHRRARQALVIFQTALTIVLLVGAGLLLKSFVLLRQVDLGLDPRDVLTADLLLSGRNAPPDRREIFLGDVLAAVQALPGVRHAGFQSDSLFGGGGSRETFTIDGQPDPTPSSGHAAAANLIAGHVFPALGMAMVRGRPFDQRDSREAVPVAIVNETMARQFWRQDDPIGKRIRLYYDKDPSRWLTIVGVVRDTRYRYEPAHARVFLPEGQRPYRSIPYPKSQSVSLVVRTTGEPGAAAAAVKSAIWSVDRNQPVRNVQPLEQILWRSVAEPRVYTLLLGSFAGVAFFIASAGIYAICAFVVARQTREIGIRLAIGAAPRQILAHVLRGGLGIILVGISLGIAGSLVFSRVMTDLLPSTTPTDVPTFATVVLLFVAVASLATYIPARRAAGIDPTVAVRCD
jgi:predicted permease